MVVESPAEPNRLTGGRKGTIHKQVNKIIAAELQNYFVGTVIDLHLCSFIYKL